MIIAMVSGKGGAGKTTSALNVAAALAEAGHDIALEDRDPQGTARRVIQELGGLQLAEEGRNYGALLIDTPPRLDSHVVADAIQRADVVVLVTSPSPADLFTSRDTAELIQKLGASDRTRVLYNNVQTNTLLARDLDDLAERIGLPAFKNRILRRQAYQHGILLGWSALSSECKEELFKVALEITSFGAKKEKTNE